MGERITLQKLRAQKGREKITALTAYDATFAALLDRAGIELVLVGDSLGMVVQGHETTLPVRLEAMVYHTAAVRRGLERAFLVADLPFASYGDPETALTSAAELMRAGAQMVKLEGGHHRGEVVRRLTEEGIPVCGHMGILPQSVHRFGYRLDLEAPEAAERFLEEALDLERAGIELLVLEGVPPLLAQAVTAELKVPVIGIGSGKGVDGQILVLYDLLGISPSPPPFAEDFFRGAGSIEAAVRNYVQAVKEERFPGDGEVPSSR